MAIETPLLFLSLRRFQGFGSSVPGTGVKTKYIFLTINHNITVTMLLNVSHVPGNSVPGSYTALLPSPPIAVLQVILQLRKLKHREVK